MKRELHELVQGSDLWHQFRLEHDGASEAAAALGLSKQVTRSELLRMKHTGIAKEFSDWVQAHILDRGHELEELALPIAEEILGEELYPATYSLGRLSASCDGLTMDGSTAWEHKQWNAVLAAAVSRGELPEEHQPQCQQIMLVTGAKRTLFMVSDGTRENCVRMFVEPDAKWFERIQAGWAQVALDSANYQEVEVIPAAVGASIKGLPALIVEVDGRVVSSNLAAYKAIAFEQIGNITTDLRTDQDFANAKKAVAWCKEGEERLELVKAQTLSQTASIDDLFRTVDEISAKMRETRLMLDRTIKTRNDALRVEIAQEGKTRFAEHIAALNARLGSPYMPSIAADFATAIKGKSSFDKMRGAVADMVAAKKIEANEIADRISLNLTSLRERASEHAFLFADTATIVLKPSDDLTMLIKMRIAAHKAEQERKVAAQIEAEREKIRAEEQRKAQAEAEAKARQEQAQKDAQERESRALQEAEARKAAEAQAAESARLRAQNEAAEAEKCREREKAEAEARAKRDAEEAAERKRQLAEDSALAVEALIVTLRQRINGSKAHAGIARAIDAYLAKKQPKVA